ncbi:hypothetical protein V1478_016331 [Vespula squamosa]|uniref:Uncharacterized protein n=1 Tax=Vespula squamosa TaxID=30214 RepID=A0ABD1ZZH3_VESSQ
MLVLYTNIKCHTVRPWMHVFARARVRLSVHVHHESKFTVLSYFVINVFVNKKNANLVSELQHLLNPMDCYPTRMTLSARIYFYITYQMFVIAYTFLLKLNSNN